MVKPEWAERSLTFQDAEIDIVCRWFIENDDNLLEALLTHLKSELALDYMGYY